MAEPPVLVTRRDDVLLIEMNRPAAKNAINLEVAERLRAAADELDSDPELVVGVLTGSGGIFSAGMDLKAFARGETPELDGGGVGGITRAPPDKPLIAAVEGWALAGGLELLLACDVAVASETAMFGIPEVKVGLVASSGGLVKLPRRVPYSVAMRMALTGEPISAEAALAFGLVVEATPPGGALEGALAMARTISRNSPSAVRVTKRVLEEAATWPNLGWESLQEPFTLSIFDSPDAHEGARAFVEKRPPEWHREDCS